MGEDDALPSEPLPSNNAGRPDDTLPYYNAERDGRAHSIDNRTSGSHRHARKYAPPEDSSPSQHTTVPIAEGSWDTCLRMMNEHDATIVRDCKEEIEGLSILAGLFSAVVTGFVIEFYRLLDPEPADAAVELLSQILHQLNASAPETPSRATFHDRIQPSALRLNILWFLSLALGLIVALFGLVVKQWLREYVHSPTAGLRMQIRVRLSKYDGFWKVQTILASLSLTLQTAVILFLLGLMDFLWHLQRMVAVPIIALCSPFLLAFAFFILAPLFSLSSPYRSPLPWFLRACGLALWQRSGKAFQHMWIDWDIQAVRTSSEDAKQVVDRRALSWIHTNSSDPTKTNAILTCVGTLDPAAILDWLAAELSSTPEEVLYHAKNCTLSQLVDQWPLPGEAALDILNALLEVLLRFDGSLKDTFEFETLTSQKLVAHKADMLSIFAAVTKKMERVPEQVISRYLDTVLFLARKTRSAEDRTDTTVQTTGGDGTATTSASTVDSFRCLSYSLDASIYWYLEGRYILPSDVLSNLIEWASFCHRYIDACNLGAATPKEDVVAGCHAFHDAAAAVFQAAAIVQGLSQGATNGTDKEEVSKLLEKVEVSFSLEDQGPTWNVCAALIASISRSPDLLPPPTVSSVLLLYLKRRDKSTAGVPAEAEGLVGWSMFWASRAHLLGPNGSNMAGAVEDEDNFLKALDATFHVLSKGRADWFKAARGREIAIKIIDLLKARLKLAQRRGPRLLKKFDDEVHGKCDGLYSALEKIQWTDPERFMKKADYLRKYIQRRGLYINTKAQSDPGIGAGPGVAASTPEAASPLARSLPAHIFDPRNPNADGLATTGSSTAELEDHGGRYTINWVNRVRNISRILLPPSAAASSRRVTIEGNRRPLGRLLGRSWAYATAWVKNVLNKPQTPSPVAPARNRSLPAIQWPATNITDAQMNALELQPMGHFFTFDEPEENTGTVDESSYSECTGNIPGDAASSTGVYQVAVNGNEHRSMGSKAAHGPSARIREVDSDAPDITKGPGLSSEHRSEHEGTAIQGPSRLKNRPSDTSIEIGE